MTNEMNHFDELVEAQQKKKLKIGKILAMGVVLLYIFFGALILNQSTFILPVLMGIIVGLFAPITTFFYLREVKRGVFKVTEEEEA